MTQLQKNCLTCKHQYVKETYEDSGDYVHICGVDNHYIGYPEDMRKEVCNKWED